MSSDDNSLLNDFQRTLKDNILIILDKYNANIFKMSVINGPFGYVVYSIFEINDNIYRIYVYKDDAEIIYCKKEDHYIYEHYDYNSPEELIEDYCDSMTTILVTGVPSKPKQGPGWISKLFQRIINFTRNHLP